jgi:arylsulfatase A-like enzyme
MPATGLDRGFDDYRCRNYTEWLDTSFGEQLSAQFARSTSRPWFGFLHLWEIHYPRRVTPEYGRSAYGRNLYDRAVSSLDNQLKRLLTPLLENTVVVLTGDHGEFLSESQGGEFVAGLKRPTAWLKRQVPGVKKLRRRIMSVLFKGLDRVGQHDSDFYRAWLGHGFHIYDPLVHIPMLMYGPGVFPSGVEISHLASHVDIFPTLASALGFQLPGQLSGMGLMPLMREPVTPMNGRAIYLEAAGARLTGRREQWLAGLRTDRYKYVRGLFNEALPEELYDLDRDPGERQNVINQAPEVAETMRTRLRELMQSASVPQTEIEISYSPEELDQVNQRLRDLGYVD